MMCMLQIGLVKFFLQQRHEAESAEKTIELEAKTRELEEKTRQLEVQDPM